MLMLLCRESDSVSDAERDMLKDCERLCDCEWNALNDSLRLAERERLRLCDLDILTLSN